MSQIPFFSIIIPTYNRKGVLRKCLNALFNQSIDSSNYEVIVIDDGSSDGTEEMLSAFCGNSNFKYIRQENKGPSVARNTGAKAASSSLILFIDDDVIASQGLVKAHLEGHRGNSGIAILGYTPFDPDCVINRNVAYYKNKWDNLFENMGKINGALLIYYYFITLNLSIERELFLCIGGFDETFPCADFEDTEFGYRFSRAGYSLLFSKEATALHIYEADFNKSCKRRLRTGYMAASLYERFPNLKEPFKVNYSLCLYSDGDNLQTGIKKKIRKIICNKPLLDSIRYLINLVDGIIPEKILYNLYASLELNYYALGFRKGYSRYVKEVG